jgi:hypothetical protein
MKNLWIMALVVACGGGAKYIPGDDGPGQGDLKEDEEGPVIEHEPIDESKPGGVAVQITAEVWDEESDVLQVELYYVQAVSIDWQTENMSFDASSGQYRATIPATQVGSAEMRYYIKAIDEAFNETVDPTDADVDRFEAYIFGVSTD